MTEAILLVALIVVVGWFGGNVAGWLSAGRPYGDPFNWRVWLGPWVYLRWAEGR